MTKKNKRTIAIKRHGFKLHKEAERQAKDVKRAQQREDNNKSIKLIRKYFKNAKVAPVFSSEAKCEKELAKQFKALSLGGVHQKKQGIYCEFSSENEDSDEEIQQNNKDSGMDVDMVGGRNVESKRIKKKIKLLRKVYNQSKKLKIRIIQIQIQMSSY